MRSASRSSSGLIGVCVALLGPVAACSGPAGGSPSVDATPGDSAPGGADAAGAPDAPTGLPVLGRGAHTIDAVRVTEIGTARDGLNTPRDLAFNPEAPEQLWVVNYEDHSVVIFRNPGSPNQDADKRMGRSSEHFLARPAALAFGAPGRLATAHEEHEVTQPTTPADFMGPTLWPSDYDTFDATGASHLDMLHNSPDAVGIAWARDNVYWVVDGRHRSLTRYDFHADHGLGGEPHEDGEVARFVEGQLGYVAGVSAGVEVDRATGLLYVADPGNARVAVLDTATGRRTTAISPNFDGTRQYRMADAELRTLVDGAAVGLRRPSGLALRDGTLYVADNETSKVFAFTLAGALVDWVDLSAQVPAGSLMGTDVSPAGELFVVDAPGNRVLRIAAGN